MTLRAPAMFNAEEGFPTRAFSLFIRFLRGHEALHYGGSELPEPLERLAPPTICMAPTGDLGIDFKTFDGPFTGPSEIRELHTNVGMAREVELDPLAAGPKPGRPQRPQPKCVRSLTETLLRLTILRIT